MTPGNYPLILYRGDTYRWQFKLWQDHEKTIPTDLAGVTVKSQFRAQLGGAVVFTLPCVVTLPNIINATLLAADCAALPQAAVWDLELTYADGTVATPLAGDVRVRQDVTSTVAP
jgi:hypothetical protein